MAFFDLIPVVGATIAAVLVGDRDCCSSTSRSRVIIWAICAIAYQQFENYVIQPQIQRRAVAVEPFIVLVSVLFGSTLFGILGAVLAIPAAASMQIAGASTATIAARRWPSAARRPPTAPAGLSGPMPPQRPA